MCLLRSCIRGFRLCGVPCVCCGADAHLQDWAPQSHAPPHTSRRAMVYRREGGGGGGSNARTEDGCVAGADRVRRQAQGRGARVRGAAHGEREVRARHAEQGHMRSVLGACGRALTPRVAGHSRQVTSSHRPCARCALCSTHPPLAQSHGRRLVRPGTVLCPRVYTLAEGLAPSPCELSGVVREMSGAATDRRMGFLGTQLDVVLDSSVKISHTGSSTVYLTGWWQVRRLRCACAVALGLWRGKPLLTPRERASFAEGRCRVGL
jgi:hypothetical protein